MAILTRVDGGEVMSARCRETGVSKGASISNVRRAGAEQATPFTRPRVAFGIGERC